MSRLSKFEQYVAIYIFWEIFDFGTILFLGRKWILTDNVRFSGDIRRVEGRCVCGYFTAIMSGYS